MIEQIKNSTGKDLHEQFIGWIKKKGVEKELKAPG